MSNTILRFFAYTHLPAQLQLVSKPLAELAQQMDIMLPEGAEKSAGLRKLLEAKDCFVRAALLPPASSPRTVLATGPVDPANPIDPRDPRDAPP